MKKNDFKKYNHRVYDVDNVTYRSKFVVWFDIKEMKKFGLFQT